MGTANTPNKIEAGESFVDAKNGMYMVFSNIPRMLLMFCCSFNGKFS